MEYCDGGTLEDILKVRRTIPEDEAREILFQIASGLQLIHHKDFGLVHRNICPKSIYVDHINPFQCTLYLIGRWIYSTDMDLMNQSMNTGGYY